MNNVSSLLLVLAAIATGFVCIALFVRQRTIMLRDQLDGRLTELLRVTKELAHAQGLAEGIAGKEIAGKEKKKKA